MAKLEKTLQGNLDQIAAKIHEGISGMSSSATFEDESIVRLPGGGTVRHMVYERYSIVGGNRVSLSIMLVDTGNGSVSLSAITSGGSQAMFFKINTIGEESFLNSLEEVLKEL